MDCSMAGLNEIVSTQLLEGDHQNMSTERPIELPVMEHSFILPIYSPNAD